MSASYTNRASAAILGRIGAAGTALALGMMLGGCSVSMPMASLMGADEDVTGSIAKPGSAPPPSPLSPDLDAEDWRRAKAAMGVALDPQGNGSAVDWANPQSGAKGTFTPVAKAYPVDAKVCRAFIAMIDVKKSDRSVQGTACVDKAGDWAVSDSKPWKKI